VRPPQLAAGERELFVEILLIAGGLSDAAAVELGRSGNYRDNPQASFDLRARGVTPPRRARLEARNDVVAADFARTDARQDGPPPADAETVRVRLLAFPTRRVAGVLLESATGASRKTSSDRGDVEIYL